MCRILALFVSGQSIRNNKEIIVRSHGAKTNVEIFSVAFLSEIPLKTVHNSFTWHVAVGVRLAQCERRWLSVSPDEGASVLAEFARELPGVLPRAVISAQPQHDPLELLQQRQHLSRHNKLMNVPLKSNFLFNNRCWYICHLFSA